MTQRRYTGCQLVLAGWGVATDGGTFPGGGVLTNMCKNLVYELVIKIAACLDLILR